VESACGEALQFGVVPFIAVERSCEGVAALIMRAAIAIRTINIAGAPIIVAAFIVAALS
jgi:hypothetical protein